MAEDIMDDVELTLEERVDVLSQYMDEAQNRIMDLQEYTSIFADCLKDVMLVLYEREKVNEMMNRLEPVKDEILDLAYSQMSQKPSSNSKASEEKISRLSEIFATEAEGPAYFEGQVIIRDRDGAAFLVECPNSSETGEPIESIALIRDEGIFVVGLNGKLLKGWSVPSAPLDPREHGAL